MCDVRLGILTDNLTIFLNCLLIEFSCRIQTAKFEVGGGEIRLLPYRPLQQSLRTVQSSFLALGKF